MEGGGLVSASKDNLLKAIEVAKSVAKTIESQAYPHPIGPRPAWAGKPGVWTDSKGVPIYPGDLLRDLHFFGPGSKRNYLYHVVTEYGPGCNRQLWAIPTHAFAQLPIIHPFDIDGACRLCTYLQNQDSCEVIYGFGPERLPHDARKRVPVNMPRPLGDW
jgi:hypothetical protein